MQVTPIKTRPLKPPQDDLLEAIRQSLSSLKERSVVVVSSKVVGIWEGRCVSVKGVDDVFTFKDTLAIQEAEWYLPREESQSGLRLHTINEGVLIGSAGIDRSNGDNHLVLWPKNPNESAKQIQEWLKEEYVVSEVAVIVSDSHSMPLRNGTTGICIGYAGLEPLLDYRGSKDIFGRTVNAERLNVIDSLTVAANLVMGEGKECTPVAVIEDAPHVVFSDEKPDDMFLKLRINMKDDIFAPFILSQKWKKGGK